VEQRCFWVAQRFNAAINAGAIQDLNQNLETRKPENQKPETRN
jgi:hypothetical protein